MTGYIKKNERLSELCVLIIQCLIISFGGWCFETVGGLVLYGEVGDRGFLTLPFCPIYGFSMLGFYLLMGTPKAPRGLGRYIIRTADSSFWGKIKKYAIYFFVAVLVPTAAELAVGGFFKLIGMPLWDYSHLPFNLFGVVCLYFSLLWGILITLYMSLIWERLARVISRIPKQGLLGISFAAVLLILGDFFATAAFDVYSFLSAR